MLTKVQKPKDTYTRSAVSTEPVRERSIEDYREFLKAKAHVSNDYGFAIDRSEVNPICKPHQIDSIVWAVRGGRRALFESFGLGKSIQQLEIIRLVLKHAGGRGLIVAPLGVRQEFKRDAQLLGFDITFIRSMDDVKQRELFDSNSHIYITNYETVRDGKLDPSHFMVTSLDEAAILRSFGGSKTFREFMRLFESVRYRFVATATPDPNEYIELLAYAAYLGIADVSGAKAQPLDAKVLTPTGWKLMGDIQVGDQVISGDGNPTQVLGIFPQGDCPIYRVTFSDGGSTECDADHLWLTKTQYERNNERRTGRDYASVKTTEQIAATIKESHGAMNHLIPTVRPVEFTAQPVTVPPYLLGVLIGDACLRDTSIVLSTRDDYIVNRVEELLPPGFTLRQTREDGCDYSVSSTGKQGGGGPGSNPLLNALRQYLLLGKRSYEKRIPECYLINSLEVRLGILQGLMDTDGTVLQSGPHFCTTSKGLAEDIQWLVRSLGGIAIIRPMKSNGRPAYRVRVSLPDDICPFSLPRKAEKVRPKVKHGTRRYIRSVEPIEVKPAQCIMVDHPSHLYVTDDFAVTHNTRFFKRDSTKADKLTIHPHKEQEFWLWVASWALFLNKPSDLGHSDEGYDLPPLEVIYHEIPADQVGGSFERDGQQRMFRDANLGVTDAAREKRETLDRRIEKMREILSAEPDEHFILWHDLETEREAIEKAVPTAISVYGGQKLDDREQAIIDFSNGKIQYLASKPVLLGAGCNFQYHCSRAIFVGIGFKFAEWIQACHRIHRFLQGKPVKIHLIYAESERGVLENLKRKWEQHKKKVEKMSEIIREFGLSQQAMIAEMQRQMGVERIEVSGSGYRLINNDCVEELHQMPDNSVGLICTSIPFSTQYEYTPSFNDFGHTESNAHFFGQMDFLTPHLFRVLQPGRLAVIHVKDRIVPGGMTGLGFQTVYPFHADCISHYKRHGFAYAGMKTIVTDVVRENNQTYRLGWTEQCKDGTKMGCGMPEYLLLFRKPPSDNSNSYADLPVAKEKAKYSRSRWQIDAHGFARSNGNRPPKPEELEMLPHATIFKIFREYSLNNVYDFEYHVKIGEALEKKQRLPVTFMLLQPASWHPDVWSDITRMRTLNGAQSAKGKVMHLCPMQFDIAERVITQFSMEGETVLDPFGGLMTVPMTAVKLRRQGIGIELNPNYFADGCAYVEAAAREMAMPTLFDLEERENDFLSEAV